MPIYEYYCPDNHRIYSFFARSTAYADRIPRCPDNADFAMEKVMSGFAITGRARDKSNSEPGPDDPRMEAVMQEMEREMAGMDESNPDPRQLAGMMRKMTDMAGTKVPEQMEEMIARMEAGEDPEKLEEELGDMEEGMEDMAGDGDDADEALSPARTLKRLRSRRPSRDPALYELQDYL